MTTSIPYEQLQEDIYHFREKPLAALGRVRMDVNDPALRPLANLVTQEGGGVCIISR
jgi:hypothetical protein